MLVAGFYLLLIVCSLGPVAWMLTRPELPHEFAPVVMSAVLDVPNYTLDWGGLA